MGILGQDRGLDGMPALTLISENVDSHVIDFYQSKPFSQSTLVFSICYLHFIVAK